MIPNDPFQNLESKEAVNIMFLDLDKIRLTYIFSKFCYCNCFEQLI